MVEKRKCYRNDQHKSTWDLSGGREMDKKMSVQVREGWILGIFFLRSGKEVVSSYEFVHLSGVCFILVVCREFACMCVLFL